ncbi:uncharacterized protein METZ01_LOCUS14991 [marine metagenome]|uniref:Uncharacterized protein n=1 Tax=marine metagenome TaxID=408172 RepID=A0A381P6V9_9ZZZZ
MGLFKLQHLEAYNCRRQARVRGDSLTVPVESGNPITLCFCKKTKAVQGNRIVRRLGHRLLETGVGLSSGTICQQKQTFCGVSACCIEVCRGCQIKHLTSSNAVSLAQRGPGWLNISGEIARRGRYVCMVKHVAAHQGIRRHQWRHASVRRRARG